MTGTRPETLSQASRFDQWVRVYLAAGLCPADAARAGWGHQLGFTQVPNACALCRPIVATFPIPAAGHWRKLRQPTGSTVRGEAA